MLLGNTSAQISWKVRMVLLYLSEHRSAKKPKQCIPISISRNSEKAVNSRSSMRIQFEGAGRIGPNNRRFGLPPFWGDCAWWNAMEFDDQTCVPLLLMKSARIAYNAKPLWIWGGLVVYSSIQEPAHPLPESETESAALLAKHTFCLAPCYQAPEE